MEIVVSSLFLISGVGIIYLSKKPVINIKMYLLPHWVLYFGIATLIISVVLPPYYGYEKDKILLDPRNAVNLIAFCAIVFSKDFYQNPNLNYYRLLSLTMACFIGITAYKICIWFSINYEVLTDNSYGLPLFILVLYNLLYLNFKRSKKTSIF